MTVWRTSKHTILCNKYLSEKFDLGLTVLDGGAAGKIFEPFDKVRASLDVILFETRESSIAERQHKTHQIQVGFGVNVRQLSFILPMILQPAPFIHQI